MTKNDIRFSFIQTIPVMFSYIVIGFAYGITMNKAGFSAFWPTLCSLVIYTGAFQFVLIPFLTAGTSFPTIFLTCLAMSSRQVFYGLSFIDRFKAMGKRYLYMVFSLTDEVYGLFTTADYPDNVNRENSMFATAVLCHIYWVAGSLSGALFGMAVPFSMEGIDFSMTALFITMTIDQIKKSDGKTAFLTGLVSSVLCLAVLGPDNFMLPALILTTGILILTNRKKGAVKADE